MSFALLLSILAVSILLIVVLTSILKYNVFISMLVVSFMLGFITLPTQDVVPIIVAGFGNTMKTIGIIIILGVMIGVLLEKSRATTSLAEALLRLTGKKNADWAMCMTGFVVGIPIFCNSGFIILSGLNKSLVERTGQPIIKMATVLATGLYSVHCLIPPHPGALAAVSLLKPNIGSLIIIGLIVAVPVVGVGFAWIQLICRNQPVSVVDNSVVVDTIGEQGPTLPSACHSILPIIIPLALMTGKSVILLQQRSSFPNYCVTAIDSLGNPEIALLVGVMIAVTLFQRINAKMLGELFDKAIEQAGPTLALTSVGGVFGAVIKATGVGELAGSHLAASGFGLIVPFGIAAFLKTGQGSSTVASITAASIVAPMLAAFHLGSESGRVLTTLAIGAGSMIVSHTNDSYFWVVTKFSDVEVRDTLRVYTSATLVMGLTAFVTIWICSKFML